ncbi:hypothetical protein I5U03_11910 [Stenotrophomonas maltophilia]|nr:hypothetical protein [Stenotrophomonas maltophilia]MBH1538182.1 hypothetical protein [Stenotrophomonas maltophilia]MBN5154063.1 hypothetical protein [Stenotrophomonas maltophilia]HEL3770850.1 hypothetical protein [Stenotrophomonas maltophilia]HEL4406934.1 hypothetical protein [Stenotrophomonas maltophilia]
MTPAEIEARFTKYEERLAAMEDVQEAQSWTITALIGSHPNLKLLLGMVRRAIQGMRDRSASAGHDPSCERILQELLETESKILQAIASRERVLARKEATREQEGPER